MGRGDWVPRCAVRGAMPQGYALVEKCGRKGRMELSEMTREVRRLSRQLDNGLDVLRETAESLAVAEAEYRKAKALAWVHNTQGTAKEREARVDADTADLRYKRDVAEGIRRAALESVRARSTQISALQSLLSAHRAEANFAKTGPDYG